MKKEVLANWQVLLGLKKSFQMVNQTDKKVIKDLSRTVLQFLLTKILFKQCSHLSYQIKQVRSNKDASEVRD